MNIKFISKINQNGKDNKIEFIAPVKISKENIFTIFEFHEPSQNILNRIEVSPTKINIFAGTTSINLDKNQETKVEYVTPNGFLFLQAKLFNLESKEKEVKFLYSLSNNQKLIGKYNITLKIEKN